MAHFFPDAARVTTARHDLSAGHYGDLDAMMGIFTLPRPNESDIDALIEEFGSLVRELGLADSGVTGFVVLVPVTVREQTLTTPVLVDIEHVELAFTSHPEMGSGSIPTDVLESNTELGVEIREQLIGVLATWHNTELAEEEG